MAESVAPPLTSFTFDRRTLDLIDRLKVQLGTPSRVEVLRRALALLDMAVEGSVEGSDGKQVTIGTKNGPLQLTL